VLQKGVDEKKEYGLNPNAIDEDDDDTKTDSSNASNGNGVKKQRREAVHAIATHNARSLLIDIPTVCYDLSLSFLSVRDLCQVCYCYY
jgi:hypothetical protein